jgi:hypothetical protein
MNALFRRVDTSIAWTDTLFLPMDRPVRGMDASIVAMDVSIVTM